MQNWSRLIKSAAKTTVLPRMHHPLTKLFPTVSASDVGVIAAELLMSPPDSEVPRIVHIEGPRRYNAIDAAATLSRLMGREVVARDYREAIGFLFSPALASARAMPSWSPLRSTPTTQVESTLKRATEKFDAAQQSLSKCFYRSCISATAHWQIRCAAADDPPHSGLRGARSYVPN
jgi:uncharacterized protein YbjT (DUF2867 family)